jgi:hypothetical protein
MSICVQCGSCMALVKVTWSHYRPSVAQRVGRGIALLFHDRGIRRGWVVSSTPQPHFTPGKDPVPILQEAGWAPGLVWTGAENLAPSGFECRTIQSLVSHCTDWATRPTACPWTVWNSVKQASVFYIVCEKLCFFSVAYVFSCNITSQKAQSFQDGFMSMKLFWK